MTLISAAKPAMRYTDLSTPDGFRFAFHCDRCGDGALSEWYAFNTEGYSPTPSGKARELLWLRQHKEAYARAENEARYEFNVCPVCGRRVCGGCFRVTDDGRGDMCIDCAETKRERPKDRRYFGGCGEKREGGVYAKTHNEAIQRPVHGRPIQLRLLLRPLRQGVAQRRLRV